jgi:hypothetical protein
MTRVLVFSLTGFLLITLLGPIQRLTGLDLVVLDVPLITVLYLALAGRLGYIRARASLFSGGIDWSAGLTGFILGYVNDVLGGGVKGIHCLSLVLIFLLCLWAARHVYLIGNLSVIVVTFVASLLTSLTAVIIRWLIGVSPSLSTAAVILAQAVLCAAVAPLLMVLYRFIDGKLSPDSGERSSLCR